MEKQLYVPFTQPTKYSFTYLLQEQWRFCLMCALNYCKCNVLVDTQYIMCPYARVPIKCSCDLPERMKINKLLYQTFFTSDLSKSALLLIADHQLSLIPQPVIFNMCVPPQVMICSWQPYMSWAMPSDWNTPIILWLLWLLSTSGWTRKTLSCLRMISAGSSRFTVSSFFVANCL